MGRLIYRIPNQTIVELKGEFFELEMHQREAFEGYVVTSAQGDRWFGFQQGKVVNTNFPMMRPFVASEAMYIDQAEFFVKMIDSWGQGKAVLSRVKEVKNVKDSVFDLFHVLEQKYENAFCYAFESDLLGNWVAATPEVLVKHADLHLTTMALAGTRKTTENKPWLDKEYEEQGLVTSFIAAVLEEVGAKVKQGPREELNAGPVKHLINRFEVQLEREKVFELIDIMHPTPAVSGLPIENAQQLIDRVEPHQRLLYTGIVGVQCATQLDLFVNLRCAQKIENELYLYLGGGLTKDSCPTDEWQETENKAQTLLAAFK